MGVTFNSQYTLAGIGGDDFQYMQVDLSPTYRYSASILSGELDVRFSLPLLAGVVRPPFGIDPSLPDETNYFKGFVRTGSAITSVNQFVNPRLQIGLSYPLRNDKTIGVHFHTQWTSYPEPQPLRMFDYGITGSILF